MKDTRRGAAGQGARARPPLPSDITRFNQGLGLEGVLRRLIEELPDKVRCSFKNLALQTGWCDAGRPVCARQVCVK